MPQAPFYEKNVNCPCCKNQVNIFFLPDVTSRLYFAKEKEDDQHVTLWQWKNPSFSHINPYYYDVLFCPECSYADLRDVFLQPQKNPSNNINNICKFLSQETNNSDSLINKFIEKISFENMNFESAIYLHLLAIKTQKLMPGPEPQENPKNNRNWKLIGRLFLRLAWLFREQSGGSNKTQVQEGYVSNLRTSIDALIKKTSMMQPDIESFLSYLIKEKEYEEKTKIYQNPIFNKYMVNFKNIKDNYTNIKKAVNNLKEVNKIHINLLKDLVPGFQDESSDIGNELLSYATLWADIPTDEQTCIKKAVEYYILAATNDPSIKDYESLNLMKFSLILLKKAGLNDELKENLKLFSKRATNMQSFLFKKKSKTRDRIAISNINAEVKKVSSIIQDVSYDFKS